MQPVKVAPILSFLAFVLFLFQVPVDARKLTCKLVNILVRGIVDWPTVARVITIRAVDSRLDEDRILTSKRRYGSKSKALPESVVLSTWRDTVSKMN